MTDPQEASIYSELLGYLATGTAYTDLVPPPTTTETEPETEPASILVGTVPAIDITPTAIIDLDTSTETGSVSFIQTTLNGPSVPTPTPPPPPEPTVPPETQGLSTGGKAGIGVGVPVVVIGLVVLLLWVLRRRRRRARAQGQGQAHVQSQAQGDEDGNGDGIEKNGFTSDSGSGWGSALPEIDGNAISEVHGQSASGPGMGTGPGPGARNMVYELSGLSTRRGRQQASKSETQTQTASLPLPQPDSQSQSQLQSESTDESKENGSSIPTAVVEQKAGTETTQASPPTVTSTLATAVTDSSSSTLDHTHDRTTSPDSRTGPSYDDMSLDDLVEKMARVRRRKDRLQHLQSLEEQEEALRREIADRRGEI